MLQADLVTDPAKAEALANRLNQMTPDLERGWVAEAAGDGTWW